MYPEKRKRKLKLNEQFLKQTFIQKVHHHEMI